MQDSFRLQNKKIAKR